jgi:hypothetical protein
VNRAACTVERDKPDPETAVRAFPRSVDIEDKIVDAAASTPD